MTTRDRMLLTYVDDCLRILHQRAAHGAKAKPTVAELNAILAKLSASRALLSAEHETLR